MRSVELFTGAGGLALGTHLAGFQHAVLAEWDHDACETVRNNRDHQAVPGIERWRVFEGDVRDLQLGDLGAIELVAGGVPCQPFSLGGLHKGMDDSRDMFPHFVSVIRALEPKAFVVENVKGLLREGFRNYFSYVLLQLSLPDLVRKPRETWADHMRRLERAQTSGRGETQRYRTVFELVNAADYGIPQTRERVFIVGFRDDLGIEWAFPQATHSRDALLSQQWVTGEYWEKHRLKAPTMPEKVRSSVERLRECSLFPTNTRPWRTVRDALHDLPPPVKKGAAAEVPNHVENPGARAYAGHTGSNLDWPAKTLKAGVHGVPGGENMLVDDYGNTRYFTAREAARIQTFPDRWVFRGAWSEAMRQLGNAVPVELARVVASGVAKALAQNHQTGTNADAN